MSVDEHCDVAIIGSGPAGLAAALSLREAGIGKVVVLERDQMPGGAVRHCGSSPFGMKDFHRVMFGPAFARHSAGLAIGAGAELRLGHTVTALEAGGALTMATPTGMRRLQARRVILAAGARETPRSARLASGLRPLGVMNTGALQSMIYLRGLVPFRKPIIIGTELVAFSAVSTCLRHGIRPVAMVEAANRATAPAICALFPRLMGIPVHYGTQLGEIQGLDRVEDVRLDQIGEGGREAQSWREDCDGVLFTGCFQPEAAFLRGSAVMLDRQSGGPQIDQFGRCSDPAYFAAGNLLRAVETGGWAWREGRAVGRWVASDLLAGADDSAAEQIEVVCGDGLKYVVPHRLTRPLSAGFGSLQIRASRPIKGRLVVQTEDRALWSRRVHLLPERRFLIPLADLSIPDHASRLVVHVVDAEE